MDQRILSLISGCLTGNAVLYVSVFWSTGLTILAKGCANMLLGGLLEAWRKL